VTADTPPSLPGSITDLSRRWAWISLAVAVAAGIAARLLYLDHAMALPGFEWTDPDFYMAKSRALFDGGSWQWTSEAFQYRYRGRTFHLPPLYQVFLSLFGTLPWSWPASAAVAQAVVPGVNSVAAYALGTNLHSRRAGVIAGWLLAISPAFVHIAPIFMQEQLYIPLLLTSLATLSWVLTGRRHRAWWFAGGLLFGLAILTRSMPLYFVPVGAAAAIWLSDDRRARAWEFGLLVLGVLALTLSYSVFLSLDVGRWIFIEDHGVISIGAYTRRIYTAPPSLFKELADLTDAFLRSPETFVGTFLDFVKAAFKPAGSRWVDIYFADATGPALVALEWYALLCTDVLFAAAVVLTPFGVVLARHRHASLVLATWPVIVILLTAIAAYGGPRYRSPAEVLLYVYLAIVAARGWSSPSRRAVLAAATVSFALFWLVR
jgi:4-amino-4-deoxy-L-arabinose transferase-like glycosyltransferase